VKKQAKIPPGGGHRIKGRAATSSGAFRRTRLGYAHVHSAVDAYSRLAYSEVHDDERAVTAIGFWRRARAFFASYGITVERVMTDNGKCYISHDFAKELIAAGIVHTRTKPYCPRTNGKVERYNRTLLNEWAYARPYRSEAARTRALDKWLHMYNHHRHHTAIGGPPISRVNNVAGQNT
jgi:transposase InsO family protein